MSCSVAEKIREEGKEEGKKEEEKEEGKKEEGKEERIRKRIDKEEAYYTCILHVCIHITKQAYMYMYICTYVREEGVHFLIYMYMYM